MSLSIEVEEYVETESAIQNEIFKSINNFEDLVYTAGAGAGKTFALIESLKYIVDKHGERLSNHNQSVICITYTNAATNEIKSRLGNSELVKVSTIHDRLWGIISIHHKELVLVHKSNLDCEIHDLNNNLLTNHEEKIANQFSAYRKLPDDSKAKFCEFILNNKDLYYRNYDKPAAEFKAVFTNDLDAFPKIINNVTNFKKIVNVIYKIENYKHCIEQINNNDKKYLKVRYDSRYNNDILHRMLISHDTLLKYSLEIVKKHDLLKQIIIDQFPYILIDEYQDTNPIVIELMACLANYSKGKEHKLFISYFGDTAQSIYDDGVGNKLQGIHKNLKVINKPFNRRSNVEIIDVINKIRNDDISQLSIYEDSGGGSVKFYSSETENKREKIDAFIHKYYEQWDISENNKLHCLVLTNKLVAELSGFQDVYACFSSTSYYKKYYDRINTELLSNELSKLGEIPSLIYKILDLEVAIKEPSTALTTVFNEEILSNLTWRALQRLIKHLKSFSGATLREYVNSIFEIYAKSEKGDFVKGLVRTLFDLNSYTFNDFYIYMLDRLYPNLDSDDNEKIEEANKILCDLIDIDLSQYALWYRFINNLDDTGVVYHTYHGTKGLEFDNVVIVMENDFGRMNKNMFSTYFKNVAHPDKVLKENELLKHENTKNLFYVSCSRSIKNLRILYLDDTSSFQDGINHIFGESHAF